MACRGRDIPFKFPSERVNWHDAVEIGTATVLDIAQ
jgi:hypothetical protein